MTSTVAMLRGELIEDPNRPTAPYLECRSAVPPVMLQLGRVAPRGLHVVHSPAARHQAAHQRYGHLRVICGDTAVYSLQPRS